MTRRSLRPQLNQIRGWVRQGRTDAWIAHQLEVTVQQIQSFKRENELEADGESNATGEEVDLRAEEAAKRAADEDEEDDEKPAPKRRPRRGRTRKRTGPLEGTFDHGEEGYGLWLDPAVEDDPVYAEHWAGHRPVRWKAPSTTARRATACGWTPPSRMIRSTPSTGQVTAPSRSRSRKTRS